MNPLVAVGIPTYNNPNGLQKTLECITHQTYKHLEIIVSDNCSPNKDVSELIAVFALKDSRIKPYSQSTNIGAHNNFRFVHSKATGKYFMHSQDDDWRSETFIEHAVDKLESDPDIAVAMCPTHFVNSLGEWSPRYDIEGITPFRTIGNGSMGVVCMGLWRREIYEQFDAHLPNHVQGGDHVTIAQLLMAGKKIGVIDSELYLKDFSQTALPDLFRNHPLNPVQTYCHLIKVLITSERIPAKNKLKIPLVAATNLVWVAGAYGSQIIRMLPEDNPIRRQLRKRFFGAS